MRNLYVVGLKVVTEYTKCTDLVVSIVDSLEISCISIYLECSDHLQYPYKHLVSLAILCAEETTKKVFNVKQSRSLLLGTLPLKINFVFRSKVVNRIEKIC